MTYYNQMLQATNIVQPDGTSVSTSYHPSGLRKATWGSRTYPVEYGYDAQGRLQTMKTWQDASDPNTIATTTWNYNGYGQLENKRYADSTGPDYAYTTAGRLQTRTWARAVGGQPLATYYGYNNAGELEDLSYSDRVTPSVHTDYNRLGRPDTVAQGEGAITTTSRYNDAGQLLAESYSGGPLDGLTVTNRYDGLLRRTNVAILDAQSTVLAATGYAYDSASRLQTVRSGSASASYSYLANSPLVQNIAFTNNGALRMTTTKSHDYLNRLTQIASVPSASSAVSFSYALNSANQRTRNTLADGSYWVYEYDLLGQVQSGKRYWSDGTPVAGQQFEYAFDDIGNRTRSKAGGDEHGMGQRMATYSANSLNQYSQRTVPGAVDVLGVALATNAVTVDGVAAYRKGEYFWKEAAITNASSAAWQGITVSSAGSNVTGNVFLPQSPEAFGYDADGNLTNDGRWTLTWDGENRLVSMVSNTNTPSGSRKALAFSYDWQGRRISKVVSNWTGSAWSLASSSKFLYDGWNLVAELNGTNGLVRSYLWGTDLSGTMEGAGGVGGLLAVRTYGTAAGTNFVAMDGNGNVSALVSASDGTVTANYEFGPFGELVRADGPMAKANPFRFSTKYQDDETDQVYYGFRFYNPTTGRWLSRDPVEEQGGANLYGFVGNDPVNGADALGQWNLWNPATYGVANGAGWSTADSFNVFHESAGWDGYSSDYYRQSVASATGFGFLGDYNACDPELARWRRLGRASTLALEILGPIKLGGWAAAGDTWLHGAVGLGLDAYGLYNAAGAAGTGAGSLSAGDQWGAVELGLGALGIKYGLSGVMGNGAKLLNAWGRAETRLAPLMQCFPAGTLVLMADGSAKPIEQIEEGDEVWADDPGDNEAASKRKVTHLLRNWTERLIHVAVDKDGDGKVDGEIKATGEHPFWTSNRGWVAAKDLKPGDLLSGSDGTSPLVLSAESEPTTTDTLNLAVEGTHTFFAFAGDIPVLVHNTQPFDIAPFGSFNSPQVFLNGGAFERHEMLQWGWMRANGYGTDAFRAGNPSMAVDRAFHRGIVTPLQKQAGLHVMQDLAGQSAYDNIRANIRVLEQSGVSRDVIARQAWQAKNFANSLPCP